jgi:cell division protein FtsB
MLLGSAAACVYFGSHIVTGRHGLEARWRYVERAELLRAEVGALERERTRLRREVTSLSGDFADPDLVEEVAREVLGFGRPGDIVVLRQAERR